MKQIIALQGGIDTGKTVTIGLLYELMKSNKYILLKDKHIGYSRDFTVLFQKKGSKIIVTTYGSNTVKLQTVLDECNDWACDILVCACFPAGVTKEMLENYSNIKTKYINKTVVQFNSNKLNANTTDAKKIMEEIEKCLIEKDEMIAKRKVMIVDDDNEILELVSIILKRHGYETVLIDKGQNLVAKLNKFRPEVILLDIQLPDSDGRLLCKEIKGIEEHSHIPVILFSANVHYANSAKDYLCDDFMGKPFDVVSLVNMIDKYAKNN